MKKIILLLLIGFSFVSYSYAQHKGCSNAYNNNASNCDSSPEMQYFLPYLSGADANKCKISAFIDTEQSSCESNNGNLGGHNQGKNKVWSCSAGCVDSVCNVGYTACGNTCYADTKGGPSGNTANGVRDGLADLFDNTSTATRNAFCTNPSDSYVSKSFCGGVVCGATKEDYIMKYADNSGGDEASVLFQDSGNLVIDGTEASLGTLGTAPEFQQLKLDVNGPIGATYYCDEKGDNCVDGSALGAVAKTCTLNNQILKWDTSLSTPAFRCQADDAGTGALPDSCVDGEIPEFVLTLDVNGDPQDINPIDGKDDGTWECAKMPEGADGLAGTNALDGADGLHGQTGGTKDDDYCTDGEVLTWKVGPYDYDNDSNVCTEGATALTASDPSVVWDAGDDLNLDGVCGTGATETDSAWICAPGGGSDGSNYWTKTGTNLSYSDGKVGIGIAVPEKTLDVFGDVKIQTVNSSTSTTNNFLEVQSSGISGFESEAFLDKSIIFMGKSALSISRSSYTFGDPYPTEYYPDAIRQDYNNNLTLDVDGYLGAVKYCTNGVSTTNGIKCIPSIGNSFFYGCTAKDDVLTWQTGPYDFDGDGVIGSNVQPDLEDDINRDSFFDSNDANWVCKPAGAGNNYWTRDANNNLSYTDGKVSIQGADALILSEDSVSFEVDYSPRSGSSNGLRIWDGPIGDPAQIDGTTGNPLNKKFGSFSGDYFSFETQNTVSVGAGNIPTSTLNLDVGGKIGAEEYCGDTAADVSDGKCITKNTLTSLDGKDSTNAECANGAVPTWDSTNYVWNCVSSSLTGVSLAPVQPLVAFSTTTYQILSAECAGASTGSDANSSTARMCTDDDVVKILMNDSAALSGISGVVNSGAPGNYSTMANDCNAWGFGSISSYFSAYYDSKFILGSCNALNGQSKNILCCQ